MATVVLFEREVNIEYWIHEVMTHELVRKMLSLFPHDYETIGFKKRVLVMVILQYQKDVRVLPSTSTFHSFVFVRKGMISFISPLLKRR